MSRGNTVINEWFMMPQSIERDLSRKLALSGQFSKQLIHNMVHSIAQNKRCLKCAAIEI